MLRSFSGPCRRFLTITAAALLLSSGGAASAAPAPPPLAPRSARIAPALARELGTARPLAVIVTLRAQVPGAGYAGRPAELLQALRRVAAHSQSALLARAARGGRRLWLLNAVALRVRPDEIRRLVRDPAVAWIDDDRRVRVVGAPSALGSLAPPPLFGRGDWGLAAIGASRVSRDYGLDGTGVRVGVIDTGVDASHPDLLGKVVAWRDFVSARATAYDDEGHGTHVAGTIAGGSSSGEPIGVAPGARLVVAKALDGDGSASTSTLLAAAQWMTDPDGDPATLDYPGVINASWGAPDGPAGEVLRPVIRRWRELGIVPVFAAGNSGPEGTVAVPAAWSESLAVGALGPGGRVARFSSRGGAGAQQASGPPRLKPDLAAPGLEILSALAGGGYASHGGTSMAAPHVAGAVALLRQAEPDLSVSAVEDLLRRTAIDVGPPGADRASGAGALDVGAALEALRGRAPLRPGLRVIAVPPAVTTAEVLTYAVEAGGAPVAVWVDGHRVPGAQAGPLIRVPVATAGAHAVELAALGADGLPLDAPQRLTVVVDRTPPTVRLSVRQTGLLAIAYRGTASDRVAGMPPGALRSRTDDGGSLGGLAVGRHAFTGPGPYWIELEARDRAGNVRRVRRVVTWPAAAVTRRLAWTQAFTTMAMPFFDARLGREVTGRYESAHDLARLLAANAPYQRFMALRCPGDAIGRGAVGVYSDAHRWLRLATEIANRRYVIEDRDGRLRRGASWVHAHEPACRGLAS